MEILIQNKLFQISIITTLFLMGCSTVTLPKSKDLLAAERFYETTAKNTNISQNAEKELMEASDTLETAAKAQTAEEMDALVYKSNNQINIAIQAANTEISRKTIIDQKKQLSDLQKKMFLQDRNKLLLKNKK